MNHSVISNLTDVLSRQAQESPDAVAIYLPDHSFTYKELDQLVWKGAAFLQQSGVHPRDVVALTFQSELLQVIVMLAIARIGGTVFSLSYDTPPMVRKELIQKTHTKLTLSDIANHYDDLYVDLDTLQNISFVEKQLYVESPTAPWIIVSGSGSTGKSKLIPVTHQQQIERMKVSFHGFPLGQTERFASMVHADHYSSKFLILSALRSGVAIVFFDRQHTAILELYDSMKITIFYMTVLHLQTLMEQLPPNTKERMNNLKALLIAGSSVPDLLRKQVAYSLSKQLFIGYGTNETGSTVRAVPPDSYRHKGTVGYPLPGFTVEVVDKADHLLPAETVGFIRIKSKAMIDGYIGDDEATQKAFKNGWFYPGDLGKFTKEGELIHLGRSDDMMIMNGINIYPAEIEQALTTHPDIVDVVTLPIKSHLNHHIPICAVTLSNNSNSTEEELLNYAEEHLGVRAPQKVIILDTIPRNEQGKLIRKELTAKIKSQLLGNSKGEKLNSKKKSFQLRQTLPFKLPKIVPFSEEQTDQWFREVLDITSEPLAYSMPPVSIQAYQDKLEMMWRILLLSRALLQAIRMPVFDAGTIVRIDTEDKEHDTFYLSLAKIDHVPKNIFLHALNLSTRIVINLSQNSITDESRQALFQLITNRFLTPHAKVAGSGKSTMPILEEVYKKNIPFMHLGNGVYQLGWGSRSKRISRSSTAQDSSIGSMLSHQKMIASMLTRDAGLPSPEHQLVGSREEALKAAKELGWPLVVKPADQDRGEGVSTDIVDETLLLQAFLTAQKASKSKKAIIERQVEGVCCRIFVSNGKMFYGVKRLPKSVRGNGKDTVRQLIETANAREKMMPPWKRSEPFPSDNETNEALHIAGLSFESVPQQGELVFLRKIESTQWGGTDEDITQTIHPDNLDLALRAAALFDLQVAGIDIITPDITVPWYQNGAIINEVNYSPQYGGGAISRASIPYFLDDLIEEDGRIPVHVFIGGDDAMKQAMELQAEQTQKGLNTVVTDHEKSFFSQQKIYLDAKGLFKRTRALLMDRRVDSLIMVIQNDEFLYTGLPIDHLDDLQIVSQTLHSYTDPKQSLTNDRADQIRTLLATVRS